MFWDALNTIRTSCSHFINMLEQSQMNMCGYHILSITLDPEYVCGLIVGTFVTFALCSPRLNTHCVCSPSGHCLRFCSRCGHCLGVYSHLFLKWNIWSIKNHSPILFSYSFVLTRVYVRSDVDVKCENRLNIVEDTSDGDSLSKCEQM